MHGLGRFSAAIRLRSRPPWTRALKPFAWRTLVLTWKAYEARDGPEAASARLACLPILAIKSAAPAEWRRSIPQELQALIRRMTAENRLWVKDGLKLNSQDWDFGYLPGPSPST